MFPGYATVYRDAQDAVHLYFFRGIHDDVSHSPVLRKPALRNLPEGVKYDIIEHSEYCIEFVFTVPVKKISCALIDRETNVSATLLFENF